MRCTCTPRNGTRRTLSTTLSKSCLVSRQDLTVGFSHTPAAKGPMYQLIIGNKGNLQVDLERRQVRQPEVKRVNLTAGIP